LSWFETAICSVVGMMLMVCLVIFLSDFFQEISIKLFPRKEKPKKFTKITRFGIKIRQKFGLIGIAFLTPIFFTPPVGAILATAFRYPKFAILLQMLLSAVVWGIAQSLFFFYVKDLIF
jgi:polyferredoxin